MPKQIQNAVLSAIRTIFGVKGTDNVVAIEIGAATPVYDVLPLASMQAAGLAGDGYYLLTVSDTYAVDGDNNSNIYALLEAAEPLFDRAKHVIWVMGPMFASLDAAAGGLVEFACGLATVFMQIGPTGNSPPAMIIFLGRDTGILTDDVVWTGSLAGRPLVNGYDAGGSGEVSQPMGSIRYPFPLRVGATWYRTADVLTSCIINSAMPIWVGVRGALPPLR